MERSSPVSWSMTPITAIKTSPPRRISEARNAFEAGSIGNSLVRPSELSGSFGYLGCGYARFTSALDMIPLRLRCGRCDAIDRTLDPHALQDVLWAKTRKDDFRLGGWLHGFDRVDCEEHFDALPTEGTKSRGRVFVRRDGVGPRGKHLMAEDKGKRRSELERFRELSLSTREAREHRESSNRCDPTQGSHTISPIITGDVAGAGL